MIPSDKVGRIFNVGDLVARSSGRTIYFAIVTSIDGSKIFLDNSSQCLKYPDRVLILPQKWNVI